MNTLNERLVLIPVQELFDMDIIPKLTFNSIVDYLAVSVGIAVGFAIFSAPMQQLKDGLRKNGGV